MAKTGEGFAMPDGSVYAVTRAAADTGGEFVEMEFVLPPGCVPPPAHVHPSQEEEYEVLEKRDPRLLLYLPMLMAQYEETLTPGRARERIPMKALAALGKLLRLDARARPR